MTSESAPAASAQADDGQPRLIRALGPWQATAMVVGIMIGSAIFIVPAEITRELGTARAGIAVWVVAGILSLFGALSFAELAAMMPQAGGQYVYLREAYGPLTGFLCGWMFFLVQQTGGISTLAAGMAQYLTSFFAFTPWQQKAVAAATIVGLTAINYRGVRQGGRTQTILTGLNVGLVVALIALGYALSGRGPAGGVQALARPAGWSFPVAFGVAMVAALWAYEGWNNVTFAAGEVRQPERNLPRALVLGTLGVMAIYVGLNLVYYHVLPLAEIAASPRVAGDTASRVLGPWGAKLVALGIVVAVAGSINGSILAGARVYYAMARDGLFFRWCAAVHPRFRTPHLSLLVQAAWAVFLVFLAGYEQLFTFCMFAAWIFYALTAFGVIVLRLKMPAAPRPYRVWAYPWVPILFVAASLWFVANTLIERPAESGWGMLIVVLGVPVYFGWKRLNRKASEGAAVSLGTG